MNVKFLLACSILRFYQFVPEAYCNIYINKINEFTHVFSVDVYWLFNETSNEANSVWYRLWISRGNLVKTTLIWNQKKSKELYCKLAFGYEYFLEKISNQLSNQSDSDTHCNDRVPCGLKSCEVYENNFSQSSSSCISVSFCHVLARSENFLVLSF